jgi:demethylmenaquinone methyltransferase/2-methoxy-6-polyprenyl-1,4-benzoquinol methylase
MGKIIVNDSESYQYLVESIRKFPNQEKFLDMVNNAGFSNTKYRNLTMGVACIHSGWKI